MTSVTRISRSSHRFRRDEDGQGLAEYALILALIAIVAIVALIFLGSQISDKSEHRRQHASSPWIPDPPSHRRPSDHRSGGPSPCPATPRSCGAGGDVLRAGNLADNLATRTISCRFLLMVLALWYSRAALGGARVVPPVTSHSSVGENQLEALQSARPARRGLPGDRGLRRASCCSSAARPATTRRRPPDRPARSSSRPPTSRCRREITADQVDDQDARPRRAISAGAFTRPVAGHRPDRPPARRHRRPDHRRRRSTAATARSSTSRRPPDSARSRSRSTRSAASARSSRPATTSTWSSAYRRSKFPVVTVENPDEAIVTSGRASTARASSCSSRACRCSGTLLPPVAAPAEDRRRIRAPAPRPDTALNGQQEIVILSVTAQQAEVIKFAQLRRAPISPGPALARRLHRPATGAARRRRSRPRPPASSSRPWSTSTASCRRSSRTGPPERPTPEPVARRRPT